MLFIYLDLVFFMSLTDSTQQSQQDSNWLKRGAGWWRFCWERPQSARPAGPGEASGQDGADVQLEKASTASQSNQICRWAADAGGKPKAASSPAGFNEDPKHTENKLSLCLVADAYCLLEVYTVLKSNPAHFGLPDDLQNIPSRQSEKSKDKRPKEQQTKQVK